MTQSEVASVLPAKERIQTAIDLLARMQTELQSWAARQYAGSERLAITEMFRTLDMCAFAFKMAPNRLHLQQHDHARRWMLIGAATALQPLLSGVAVTTGPMPWAPSEGRWTRTIDEYLHQCGQLVWLHRLASLEKYGLGRATVESSRMKIELLPGGLEAADREALGWLALQKLNIAGVEGEISLAKQQLKRLRRRLDKKSGTDMGGWFIRYSEDDDLMERSLRRVRELEPIWAETEALPDGAHIGGRTFREWKDACGAAAASVLHHLEFATRFRATHPQVELRNLLTMFLRRDDLARLWEKRGLSSGSVDAISQAMMLDHKSAADFRDHHGTPLPFYVDMGKEFVLIPSMTALLNPFVDVVRHLRSRYRDDWGRAVESREAVFRADLSVLFKPPRFNVLPSGTRLRRRDGTLLTDVDAVVLDQMTGTVALVQLKWHDVVAHSLRERESRKRNLLAANQWVDRVCTWIGEHASSDIASALGLSPRNSGRALKPVLLVVARYAARFSGAGEYDPRSGWLSWPELARQVATGKEDSDILRLVSTSFARPGQVTGPSEEATAPSSYLRFPGLEVEIVTRAT